MTIIPEFDGTNGMAVALARIAQEAEAKTGGLDLSDLGLSALPEALRDVPHLRELDCSWNAISSLDGLQNCTALQSLDCSNTQITNLDALQNCAVLQSLDCFNTQITNLEGLQNCAVLQSLDCFNTQITSLDGLQNCTALQRLYCFGTQITSLDGLQNCTELQRLSCSFTEITGLDGLQNCTELQSLYCAETQITSLDALQNCTALQILNCSYTQITNLDALQNCTALQSLYCFDTPLKTYPPEFLARPALESVIITTLSGFPPEILSNGYDDNCLPRLRDYLADREQNPTPVRDVKLFLLGNGGTGKTQMARHLRGEAFSPDWDSTHGIQVTTATLPGDDQQGETRLHLWDFGGQELYHSTHTLFLRSRAVFALLWSADREPADASTLNVDPRNFMSRTYPRQYWLDHIADHAGADSPVLLVQSKCDTRADEQPAPPTEGAAFAFLRRLQFGAQKPYRARDLRAALQDAVDHLRENEDVRVIGQAWQAVQHAIENLREADGTYRPENQRRDQAWFADLCAQHGVKSAPATLRTYLHRCGVIFYQPGLFGDQIILDQTWAIGAIYALFSRDKVYSHLREKHGRFTLADLSALVWDAEGFSPDEQALFLSFMETCGICFAYQGTGAETIYLAPDLLPEQSAFALELDEAWHSFPGQPATMTYDYSLLHRGIMRALICRIGQEAQMRGRYWRDGLYVYEATTRSRAYIRQIFGPRDGHATAAPWAGSLTLEVKGDREKRLFDLLRGWIEDINHDFGVKNPTPRDTPPPRPDEAETFKPTFTEEPMSDYKLYVSYCWKDLQAVPKDEKAAVETFMETARGKNIPVLRDKDAIKFGEKLKNYMKSLSQGQRIFIFMSDSYLRSPYCMYELYHIWKFSEQCKIDFIERVRIYLLGGLKITKPQDIAPYAEYWESEHAEQKQAFDRISAADPAPELRENFGLITQFYQSIATILSTINSHLRPVEWDEFIQYALDDLTPSP
ncbi:hypothetical protein GCM10011497_21360 [Elstera cyanobacteriorum]|uniref:TIR domain-containing protein n=1 Tax=Elstera cyanobacteriorum TaxID=2022747 RepID=A0A255XSJ4_9PROT|nr:leucine-rich repeat domain-containing protein [Elstera cyanobacteriorum]OYQ19405.1 hypothetical protein CHR90_08255 [Elstera cyanobacteriorum]GFZ91193.1 hypothetical protein GCM10011497_21360 [Elstera cyanobacteriorum]